MAKAYWLCKSEPDVFSIDDLKKTKRTLWGEVRNYQARNFLKEMRPGDLVLFYYSNAEPTGIAGLAKVTRSAIPDPSQFDKKSDYYEPRASKEKPIWVAPEFGFVEKFQKLVTREELKAQKALSNMLLLKKGSRLSVNPLTKDEYELILKLAAL